MAEKLFEHCQIRPVLKSDLSNIVDMLDESERQSWSKKTLEDTLTNARYQLILLYVVDSKVLVGFYITQLIADQMTLMQLTIKSAFRRQGLGRLLMANLIEEANKKQCVQVLLELRESNVAAQNLYKEYGFKQVGRRSNYYPPTNSENPSDPNEKKQREDALLYTLTI